MGSVQLALFIIGAFAIFKTGDALRCWHCSSDSGAPCSDYFNTTRYSYTRFNNNYQNYGGQGQSFTGGNSQVMLQECDSGSNYFPTSGRNQRAVCMKKTQTTYGRTTYIRQCRFLHADEKVGYCPTETTSSATTVDFCEYCDYDGCNGAQTMHNSFYLAAVLPLMGMLFMRK